MLKNKLVKALYVAMILAALPGTVAYADIYTGDGHATIPVLATMPGTYTVTLPASIPGLTADSQGYAEAVISGVSISSTLIENKAVHIRYRNQYSGASFGVKKNGSATEFTLNGNMNYGVVTEDRFKDSLKSVENNLIKLNGTIPDVAAYSMDNKPTNFYTADQFPSNWNLMLKDGDGHKVKLADLVGGTYTAGIEVEWSTVSLPGSLLY